MSFKCKWRAAQTLWLTTSLFAVLLTAAPAVAQTITAVMQSGLRVMDPIMSSAAITNIHG